MIVTCQACGAENDDEARFCDQCGSPLAAALSDVAIPASPTTKVPQLPNSQTSGELHTLAHQPDARMRAGGGQANWLGLGLIALVIAGLGYLVFGGKQAVPAGESPTPAGQTGQQPGEVFGQVQKQLKEYNQRLAADPTDMEALRSLYEMYGQIGQTEKMLPKLQTALAALKTKVDGKQLDNAAGRKVALDLSMTAMNAGDATGAVEALKYYYVLNPERVSTAAMIGNIYYDLGQAKDAIEWYTKYLTVAAEGQEGTSYVSAQVDRSTMRLKLATDGEATQLATALAELREITKAHPEHWAARFNLGQGLLQNGDSKGAEDSWQLASKLAKTPEEKWRTQAALAHLHGEPEPPRPPGMEEGGGMASSGENPHAGAGVPPTASDPHAGMGIPPGADNPHAGL